MMCQCLIPQSFSLGGLLVGTHRTYRRFPIIRPNKLARFVRFVQERESPKNEIISGGRMHLETVDETQ